MDVSENSGFSPQIIHGLIGFSIINHPFGGNTPIFGSTPIWKLPNGRTLQFDLGQKAQFETPFSSFFKVTLLIPQLEVT